MCGIVGIFLKNKELHSQLGSLFSPMLTEMGDRGPDSSGFAIYRDKIDNFEMLGKWFWEETNAGKLLLAIEAVSLESDDQVLRQIASMSLLTPRFWSEGPLPGISGSGWT